MRLEEVPPAVEVGEYEGQVDGGREENTKQDADADGLPQPAPEAIYESRTQEDDREELGPAADDQHGEARDLQPEIVAPPGIGTLGALAQEEQTAQAGAERDDIPVVERVEEEDG